MPNFYRALVGLMILSVSVVDVGSSFAQTSASTTSAASPKTPVRHRFRRTAAPSGPARNVGPDSSVEGAPGNSLGATRNGNDGLPIVPGAPSAGGNGSTGGH